MILQNCNGENKVFIDENLNGIDSKVIQGIPEEPGNVEILLDREEITLFLEHEQITVHSISRIIYDSNFDSLLFILKNGDTSCVKWLKDTEIISLSKSGDEQQLIVSTMNIPKFLSQENYDEKYPKFEVNLSDCTYGMKIYMNDSEFIEIPDFQSHNNIHSTIDYIAQIIFYLSEGRPDFIDKLCSSENIEIEIKDKGCETFTYVLGEEGIFLTGGELENYLVEWQKFFKLVMDGKWEVDFE